MRMSRFIAVLLALSLPALAVHAADPIHLQLPQDTLAFVELDPVVSAGNADQSALLDLGVQAMQSMGILSRQAGEVGDALSLASVAGNHHSCLALLDADLVAQDGDLECRSIQLVWIIDTAGQSQDMVDRLTNLLSHLSTRATARQSVHKTPEEKREYVQFHDANWPDWLTLAWTQQGDRFILAVGDGAMEHYLADRPVGGVPWQQTFADIDKAAAQQGSTGDTLARIYVSAKAFRDRFPQPMQKTSLGKLFANFDLSAADAALFSARLHDRAISLDTGCDTNGVVTDVPWTVPLSSANAGLLKLIPPEANAYLALNVQWPALYDHTIALLAAILPATSDGPLDQDIADFARLENVNIQEDILAHLEPIVLVHDWPQHPLRLPLMVTVLAAADPAHQEDVRKALDTLLSEATNSLNRRAARQHVADGAAAPISADADFTHLRLRTTDKDGITYLQFGLVGPGWTWVQNRFVFSWSPAAVRANVPAATTAPADAFSLPVSH